MSSAFQELRLSRKLGEGSAAEVFLAQMPISDSPVVLKVVRPELTQDAALVGRFLDEVQLCQRLSHPGVVRTLDSGQLRDGRVFLMTEFLDGEDLRTCLTREVALAPSVVKRLARALCDALAYVHDNGVVHGDLSPETIFLAGGLHAFSPKLLDFGLGLFRGSRFGVSPGSVPSRPASTPPECIAGQPSDARSDLYALGVLLYELLTGAPPFSADDEQTLLQKQLHDLPPPLPPEADSLSGVVMRCLAKSPADRFQGARDVALVLDALDDDAPFEPTRIAKVPTPLPLYPPVEEALTFGSYQVLELIGEGAMGNVYLAEHQRLGKKVAIKMLKAEHAKKRDLLERFFQEARAVNQINHEHIVDVQDFVDELAPDGNHRAYFVMELLTGQTFGQILAEGAIPVSRVVNILRQVCEGLGAAHRVSVVHRDVKPDNIFVTERSDVKDYVKLVDFGVAKLNRSVPESTGSTVAGTIIGTPDYMSPEQAAGSEVDFRSDIYSLGVVLYEALTLRRPFQASSFGQLVVDINTKPVPPLPRHTPKGEPIPRALEELVMRCLEKDPAQRPASMEAVEEALANALQASSQASLQASLEIADFSPSRDEVSGPLGILDGADEEALAAAFRPRKGRYVVAALVLVLLGGGGYLVESRGLFTAHASKAAPVTPPLVQAAPKLEPKVEPKAAPAPVKPAAAPARTVAKADVPALTHPAKAKPKVKPVAKQVAHPRPHAQQKVSHDGVIDPYAGQ